MKTDVRENEHLVIICMQARKVLMISFYSC